MLLYEIWKYFPSDIVDEVRNTKFNRFGRDDNGSCPLDLALYLLGSDCDKTLPSGSYVAKELISFGEVEEEEYEKVVHDAWLFIIYWETDQSRNIISATR